MKAQYYHPLLKILCASDWQSSEPGFTFWSLPGMWSALGSRRRSLGRVAGNSAHEPHIDPPRTPETAGEMLPRNSFSDTWLRITSRRSLSALGSYQWPGWCRKWRWCRIGSPRYMCFWFPPFGDFPHRHWFYSSNPPHRHSSEEERWERKSKLRLSRWSPN